ncbi:hypothetical protein NC652_017072 [Populus alba x Populus x berolinensis]|nr:hypothetical protein NC652_017072 [Populus alba x Populus x berolinensis]
MSYFNLFKSFQDSRYFLRLAYHIPTMFGVCFWDLIRYSRNKQKWTASRWTRGRRLVPSPTAPFLAFFFLRRPKHGQQSQVTIFGRLGSFGGSYPYRACLLKTHPVPTYTGP